MIQSARKTLFIAAFTLTSCSTQAIPAATPTINTTALRLHTTPATAPLMKDLAAAYTATYPDYVLDIRTEDYDTLAQTAMPETYFLTNHLPTESPLWAAPIGQDGIAIVTAPSQSIQTLTTRQLRSIYQGQIDNWQQVGGADLPIQVISRENGAATTYEFHRLVMGNRRVNPSALIVPSNYAMLQTIQANPGSIGYISVGHLQPGTYTIAIDGIYPTPDNIRNNIYPLRSTLFMVGVEEPGGDYRSFIGWLQGLEGQQVIAQRYIPLLIP